MNSCEICNCSSSYGQHKVMAVGAHKENELFGNSEQSILKEKKYAKNAHFTALVIAGRHWVLTNGAIGIISYSS